MTRPLRIQYAGALYHVTSRGDRQAAIYRDDTDRRVWLSVLDLVCKRYNFVVLGFCQMTNHYHLVVETIEGNLAQGMRVLNSTYSQYFNRRHEVVGHVFQGRYKAILVQRDPYLLELTRYVILNPLRAGMVTTPEAWPWSSHGYITGTQSSPPWFDADAILRQFAPDQATAVARYCRFVLAGVGLDSPLKQTRHQLALGNDAFVTSAVSQAPAPEYLAVSKTQRRAAQLTLAQYRAAYPRREQAMAQAYRSTAYTMQQIATFFGVSTKTVSRAVKSLENAELVSECRH
jgi:REP element-mobilizing transposase RayT/AraC-like DNA-binding protein